MRPAACVRNRAVIEFQPKRSGAASECFDGLVYAVGVRQSPFVRVLDLRGRDTRPVVLESELRATPVPIRPNGAADSAQKFSMKDFWHGKERCFVPAQEADFVVASIPFA
jgi:hypothetical protein